MGDMDLGPSLLWRTPHQKAHPEKIDDFMFLFVLFLVKTQKARAEITSKIAAESRRDLCSEAQS